MSRLPRRLVYARIGVGLIGYVIPALTLIPLGGIWLWQRGLFLYWAGAVLGVTLATVLLQLWLLRPRKPAPAPAIDEAALPDPSWTPAEQGAWAAVLALAGAVRPEDVASRDAVLALGMRTLEIVARHFNPDEADPLWRFTVPEALALIERVSLRMRGFVLDTVPLGDRLTVQRIIQLYGWSAMIDHIERAYDLWRVVRPFVYPVAAVTQEIRERLGRKLYQWGRDELTTKLARHYVEEVGRAAVELYGGRLKVTAPVLAAHVSPQTRRDRAAAAEAPAEPLRILVAGQVSAGKSSLINVLSEAVRAAVDALPATASFAAYELSRPDLSRPDLSRPDLSRPDLSRPDLSRPGHSPAGLPAALLLDSPGLRADPAAAARLIAEAAQCDLVLWVVDASRADRENDRAALTGFRAHFGAQPNRRRPPVILVLTHIDRLRPFQEWQPPYDVAKPQGPKAKAIRAAMETVGAELGFALEDLVPCCLDEAIGRYNIDAVWAKILATLPEAERAHLVRRLGEARAAWDWGRLWTQAVNAGRVIARAAVG